MVKTMKVQSQRQLKLERRRIPGGFKTLTMFFSGSIFLWFIFNMASTFFNLHNYGGTDDQRSTFKIPEANKNNELSETNATAADILDILQKPEANKNEEHSETKATAADILDILHCIDSEFAQIENSGTRIFCLKAQEVLTGFAYQERLPLDCPSETLFEIWKLARTKMNQDLLRLALSVSRINPHWLLLQNHRVQLIAPKGDQGLRTVLQELNRGILIADYGIRTFPLGNDVEGESLFVDVGSNLGLVSLVVSLMFNKTRVVSIEAAAPTWMYQQINMQCNLPRERFVDSIFVVHAGAADASMEGQSVQMMWGPSSTTSTSAWTERAKYKKGVAVELSIPLRTIRSILQEYIPVTKTNPNYFNSIVMKVDCEGCEYNAIPDMSEEESDAITVMVGEIHWGYIPPQKLPSSARGEITHRRMCRHENFARQAKECCAFPKMAVDRGLKGTVWGNGVGVGNVTVAMVAGKLCDHFGAWAAMKRLWDVKDDSGWLSNTSSVP